MKIKGNHVIKQHNIIIGSRVIRNIVQHILKKEIKFNNNFDSLSSLCHTTNSKKNYINFNIPSTHEDLH